MAATFHEAAHCWVAWRLGDKTAKHLTRVTFNPVKQFDIFGTIILPSLMLIRSGCRMMFGFEINIFWWLVGGPADYLMRYMFSSIGVL